MDLVIPLSNKSSWQDNELRYALRSVEQYLMGIDNVWTIGNTPEWLTNTIHIPLNDITRNNPDANIIAKVEHVCKQPALSENFIRMSDDQIVLRPVHASEIPMYHVGKGTGSGRWYKRLQNTLQALERAGVSNPRNYDAHYPAVYNKKAFLEAIASYKYWEEPGYTINSLYFNQVAEDRIKLPKGYRVHLRKSLEGTVIKKICNDAQFLCYNDDGLNPDLKKIIAGYLSTPSTYEK